MSKYCQNILHCIYRIYSTERAHLARRNSNHTKSKPSSRPSYVAFSRTSNTTQSDARNFAKTLASNSRTRSKNSASRGTRSLVTLSLASKRIKGSKSPPGVSGITQRTRTRRRNIIMATCLRWGPCMACILSDLWCFCWGVMEDLWSYDYVIGNFVGWYGELKIMHYIFCDILYEYIIHGIHNVKFDLLPC